MADNPKQRRLLRMPGASKKIQNLRNSTDKVRGRVYGVNKNIPALLLSNLDDYSDKINSDREKNKSLINTHTTFNKVMKGDVKSIYDIVEDNSVLKVIEGALGAENVKFTQLLKDYEIIKRCIPQIHRVVNLIISSILSPDTMGADNIVGIDIPTGTSQSDQKAIRNIIDKYKINQKLQDDIVRDYLIASVKYVTVVPYSMIPDMMRPDPDKEGSGLMNLSEAITNIENLLNPSIKTLHEAAGEFGYNESKALLESVVEPDFYESIDYANSIKDIGSIVNTQLEHIEFIDGGAAYFKNAIINEAIETYSSDDKELKSMKSILNRAKQGSYRKDYYSDDYVVEGMIDDKTYKDIKKNVDFKGAHIEYLPADRVVAFKLRDTIIGYFYVEDIINPNANNINASSIMDKINASVYIQNSARNKSKEVEDAVVRNIANKLIKAVNSKFINDNIDDMEIIYEFIKYNEIHRKSKRVVFFHPDDVCEFKRADGSIMKNCMFFAKLAILTLLSNVIGKVVRGSDRQIHYVKTGLTTDIEGSVNDTIRAIKQNQIRYSDIGTINEIFNFVGSNVDVFMPVSIDGEKPIETDTIPGQNIDMNDEFISWIIRSILHSFDMPPGLIDDLESVQFAKTIAMTNLETAKSIYNSQVELNPDLTKLIQLIIHYELPDYDKWREVKASFNPPAVIVYELTRDRMDAVDQFAEKIADLYVAPDGEGPAEKRRRLMKLEYYKKNMPTWEWSDYDAMYRKISIDTKEQKLRDEIDQINENNTEDTFGNSDSYTSGGDEF